MALLAAYLEDIVKPTFDDFRRSHARNHAFLTALALYHSIDRARVDQKLGGIKLPKGVRLRNVWGEESMAFRLIDAAAHRFKHMKSDLEPYKPERWNPKPEYPGQKMPEVSIGYVLGTMGMVEFRATVADALEFVEGTLTNPPIASDQKPPKYKTSPKAGPSPDAMGKYIEEMVEPTYEDFRRNENSPRHAFLACVTTYHAIDRALSQKDMAELVTKWQDEVLRVPDDGYDRAPL